MKPEADVLKNKIAPKSKNLLKKDFPAYYFLLLLLVLPFSCWFLYRFQEKKFNRKLKKELSQIENVSLRILVEDEYKLIKPLAFVEFNKEDTLLMQIKESINDYIEKQKQAGSITAASAYLRNLNHFQDVRINPSEVYFPGSLMKIPILITYLKISEKNPEILNRRIAFARPYSDLPIQNIRSKAIQLGTEYSVQELMEYMIAYSDNNATALLSENIEFEKIAHVFEDLQLPKPDKTKHDYGITLKDYSRFFRVLFNASYLSWDKSEFALQLLTRTDYKTGILKYIDKGIPVAHKFGERNSDGNQQLHEIGIVYLKDRPYLIGVMTKGKDLKKMEPVLSEISRIAFEGMKYRKVDE